MEGALVILTLCLDDNGKSLIKELGKLHFNT